MIEAISRHIDARLADVSGKAFYSGRSAFSRQGGVYLLGYNPGGDPGTHQLETVAKHTRFVLERAPANWSAYRDEAWQGTGHVMQRRMQHLFRSIKMDPGEVAASNLIFTRSKNIAALGEKASLIEMCWEFHAISIKVLLPKAIICLGTDCAHEVRRRIGANQLIRSFTENNNRNYVSTAWRSPQNVLVFQLTHPSRVDWTNPDTDPTPMVSELIEGR